ncbi:MULTISPECIES: anti-repressor SinI family protein [Bacillaceae]|uniref:anti-repressor SinI family protein n=1 Tax=Bacillaceae TaxID=186817 RepID=UPI001BDED067|nr:MULTISPECIES: anti-repressor SinI family protein [Bacillaceae]MDX8361043.1 anti-repressor SinI family protein [Cytobacillus sp. IB215316]
MESVKNNFRLDREWVDLICEALDSKLTVAEIKEFLQQNQSPQKELHTKKECIKA